MTTFKTELELNEMDKKAIDKYGDSIGMHLDRRLKKEKLVKQVLEYQKTLASEDRPEEVPPMPAAEPVEVPVEEAYELSGLESEIEDTPPEFEERDDEYNWMVPVGVALVVFLLLGLIIFA